MVSGRTYTYKVSQGLGDKDKYVVDFNVAGNLRRPYSFSSKLDVNSKKFSISKNKDIMPNSLDIPDDDSLTGLYRQQVRQTYIDPQMEPRVVAGQGLDLARGLVPAFNAFCAGGTSSSLTKSQAGAK